ncbi:MAG: hypothetical protein LDL23_11855 [Flavobacterium sp.]|jgi:S-adenosylmethionine synthetase|uniref:hypothetical protein n=1 Tax=Flavobacterium TaxID=237 RepID=UPI0012374F06|nr:MULTISPECIES: hypothetical protein [Flavobacterium]MCA1967324.1 hypothetical protein [Flavobacterium sp.]
MENWYFILVPVVLISVVLVFKFFKMEQDYKSKSKEIQQKIEELKARNSLCQNKINIESFDSKKMNQITNDFLSLHNLIVKRYLR